MSSDENTKMIVDAINALPDQIAAALTTRSSRGVSDEDARAIGAAAMQGLHQSIANLGDKPDNKTS